MRNVVQRFAMSNQNDGGWHLERAVSICKNASYTSLPSIGLKALEAKERDPSSVRGAIEEESIDFLPKIEARIGVLPALATLIASIAGPGSRSRHVLFL